MKSWQVAVLFGLRPGRPGCSLLGKSGDESDDDNDSDDYEQRDNDHRGPILGQLWGRWRLCRFHEISY